MWPEGVALAAIGGMALVTLLLRAGGVWLAGRKAASPRVASCMRHAPGAILTALLAPLIVAGGVPALGGAGVTFVASRRTGNLALAILAGLTVFVALEALIGPETTKHGATTTMRDDAEAPGMARIWIGHTRPEDREEYVRYLETSGMAEYRATAGNLGAWLLVREVEGRAEFLALSLWESWESIRRFAGPDPDRARYFPDDERYLLEFPETVQHFEVRLAAIARPPGRASRVPPRP